MLRDPAAKRYALAGFELARERNELDDWERDLAGYAAVLALPEAQEFVANRRVDAQAKEQLLQRIVDQPSPLAWNLVRLLSSKGRLGLLPQIAEAFQELLDDHRGIAHASVTAAVAMSDDDQQALASRLSTLTGKEVRLELHQDEAILGGLIVRIGDSLIDGSTRTKLVALKRRLAGETG